MVFDRSEAGQARVFIFDCVWWFRISTSLIGRTRLYIFDLEEFAMDGSEQGAYKALVENAETTDLKWRTVLDGDVRPPSSFFTHTVNCTEKQNISCKCSYGRMNCAEMDRLHLTISDISLCNTGSHSIQKLSTHELNGLTTLASSLGITSTEKFTRVLWTVLWTRVLWTRVRHEYCEPSRWSRPNCWTTIFFEYTWLASRHYRGFVGIAPCRSLQCLRSPCYLQVSLQKSSLLQQGLPETRLEDA